ncbi:IPIL1 protein, partial [Nyctiprogne leucopyga]|nr:IPIL1 protein [Nyctiprogne leucopyga]
LVQELVGDLLLVPQELLSNSFFSVLQPAIGVGSTFQGWSPLDSDAVYCMLMPLEPHLGHAFHGELGTVGQMSAKGSCVCVELECTCMRERLVEDMLYFLHHPKEVLRRNQTPSFLCTLCTGIYLDVWKTVLWFQKFVRSAWVTGPHLHCYNIKVLPSSRSCKLQLTDVPRRILIVEMIFGVQRGNSDIFLCSQTTETIFTPSTTWTESYTVAEVKFFRHVARQAPHNSFYLMCLQLCAGFVGIGFSTYTLKTVVMHLLSTTPLSGWCRRDFLLQLMDIMHYLCLCLEGKHLDHFFGSENVPEEIILPPAFQMATPLSLFQPLAQDPVAHTEALCEFNELQDQ